MVRRETSADETNDVLSDARAAYRETDDNVHRHAVLLHVLAYEDEAMKVTQKYPPRHERMRFKMPPHAYLLPAIRSLQHFETVLASYPNWTADFYLQGMPPEWESILPQITHRVKWYCNELPIASNLDIDFVFDPISAYRLSTAAKMHCTVAFGLQLGSGEPGSPFPLLTPPEFNTQLDDNLISRIDLLMTKAADKELFPYYGLEASDKAIVYGTLKGDESLVELMAIVKASSVVVGEPSFATYYAASIHKPVVELYPDDIMHTGWLSKFFWSPYYMVRGSLVQTRRQELLRRAVRLAWDTRQLQD